MHARTHLHICVHAHTHTHSHTNIRCQLPVVKHEAAVAHLGHELQCRLGLQSAGSDLQLLNLGVGVSRRSLVKRKQMICSKFMPTSMAWCVCVCVMFGGVEDVCECVCVYVLVFACAYIISLRVFMSLCMIACICV